MFKNNLKVTLRNLRRHKTFSIINVLGLTVGLLCTILILLWVNDELSYDRFFKNADNTYLVLRGDIRGMTAVTSKLLAPAVKEKVPEIQKATSMLKLPEGFEFLIRNGDKGFDEKVIFGGPNFFNFFSFKFKEGNPITALAAPNSIVITKEIAEKYFGNEDAMGKSLEVSGFGFKSVVKVSGILESIPTQSHIQRQIYLSIDWFSSTPINFNNWDDQSFYTYVQLNSNSALSELPAKIMKCEVMDYNKNQQDNIKYSLFPMTKIHLYGGDIQFLQTTGDIKYVHIFIVIAFIILLIAGINYMNLSTSLALKRTKEVGIKKTVGANRNMLILQFFEESFILAFFSYFIAVLLAAAVLPVFNLLTGKELVINLFDPSFIIFSLLIICITGLISGSYPALFLSSFSPVQILKGKLKVGFGSLITRKGLVVFQFVITISIIACTLIVLNQLSFVRNSDLGFDKENLLCVKMTTDANSKFEVLKHELMKNPEIISIARSEPVTEAITHTEDVSWKGKSKNEEVHFCVLHSDCSLADVYKFRMKSGRFFSENFRSDSTDAYVINEAAAKAMGLSSPLQSNIKLWGKSGTVIGVVKDYHYSSFHTKIEPLIIKMPDIKEQAARFRVMTIRFNSKSIHDFVSSVEKTWSEQLSGTPCNYYFYDDSLNKMYFSEIRMGTVFKYFSFLSILIACLGLFGLVSITAEQKTKEIGIRKVLGASISKVALILSKEFLILVIVSNIIAWPIAYYFMNGWLQDFAYRINISWWVFVLAGSIALLIALITVSFQSVKAAIANPIDSLRYE